MSDSLPPGQVRGIRRVVYVVLALLFLGLGLLGVALPGLPRAIASNFLLHELPLFSFACLSLSTKVISN